MSLTSLLAFIPQNSVNTLPRSAADQNQIDAIFNGALMIAGAICILFIIIGALRYTTSQGNSDATRSGREMLIYAVVGLVIIMLAFIIVQLVIGVVNQK